MSKEIDPCFEDHKEIALRNFEISRKNDNEPAVQYFAGKVAGLNEGEAIFEAYRYKNYLRYLERSVN